ncbi:MAG: DUF2330 domain-containing protein [Patescibacteria group bacterium]|nr:DUF2330 domain-containing protein [Patescibacteria group bacterium]
MTKKFIYFLLIITFIISPFSALADGVVIRPLPEGDWTWVDQNSQQAFINYEQGIEKLIIAVDLEEEKSDIAWIIPVPSTPEKVGIDITSELPIFFGDEIISKAKIKFSENLTGSYYAGLFGQIWTFPLSIIFVSLSGAGGGISGEMASGDLVSVETHIEKAGMIAEVITAKNSQAIYNYFSQKGFNIKQEGISELNSYIEKDYSFVVSWIASGAVSEESRGQRGIFMSFPTSKIYYPLILTSAYEDLEVPITIRVLDHVKPEIFSEIKPYTEVSYFTERTKGHGGAREARCYSDMAQFKSLMEMYRLDHNRYPSSLQELENDKERGDEAKLLLGDIKNMCNSRPLYSSKIRDDYTMALEIYGKLLVINSSGFFDFSDIEKLASPELEKFYGGKKPWKKETEYTKITINAPAKLLKKDLWMERGRPLKISSALWAINNSLIVALFLYLLIVGIASFIAGGLAGLLCFRKFKKYALLGLSNILTLIGLVLISNYVRKKWGADIRHSRLSFPFSFSIIFVLLLSLPLIISMLWRGETELQWIAIKISVWAIISWPIFLLIEFLLNKIGLKNKAIRAILTIILFIIFWIAIGFFFFFFFLIL